METVEEKPQVEENPLESGVKSRIIVREMVDGTISIQAKTQGPVSVVYLAGLLEVAKADIINQHKNEEEKAVNKAELVDVVLDQIDFDLDVNGELNQMNKQVGDIIQMPKAILELRDLAKKRHVEQSQEK